MVSHFKNKVINCLTHTARSLLIQKYDLHTDEKVQYKIQMFKICIKYIYRNSQQSDSRQYNQHLFPLIQPTDSEVVHASMDQFFSKVTLVGTPPLQRSLLCLHQPTIIEP